MQPKNLIWKFAFVALLAGLALYSAWAMGLRFGIDLEGGNVLTFEVETLAQQRRAVLGQIDAVNKQIESTRDPQEKKDLTARLAELIEKEEGLRGDSDGDIVQQVIDRLKARVDPTGLIGTEWRKVGPNRFEVRMPLAGPAAEKAKDAFYRALSQLQESNIERSEIRRVELLAAEAQAARGDADKAGKADEALAEAIANVSGGDGAQSDGLAKVGQGYVQMAAKEARLAELRAAGAPLQQTRMARDALNDARFSYRTQLDALVALNVNTELLGRTLELYVTKQQRDSLPEAEVATRDQDLQGKLDELLAQHPGRASQIKEVRAAYEKWAELRRGMLSDPADLKRLVAKAGVLEFRIAAALPGSEKDRGPVLSPEEYARYRKELADQGPLPGRTGGKLYQWFPLRKRTDEISMDLVTGEYVGKKYILLCNEPGLTMLQGRGEDRWSLNKAFPDRDDKFRPAVGFQFNRRGASFFGLLTSNHKGKYLAVLLDDEVYSAPTISTPIYKRGVITGSFSAQEVEELVKILNAGSLAGRVNEDPVRETAIAASIGRDNRDAGIRASVIALVCVAAFMMFYYLYAGGIANVALLLNLVLVLGAMSFTGAYFTLPGIAGIILTIGMAVDANVLIFERLREEQAKTQSLRMAIRNAYSSAATAILDSNITTLLTCLILGWVGTEEVRGFAITLSLGVMFSLFTSLVVTRWVFQGLVELGVIKNRIRMVAFIGTPKINWMAKRRIFWGLSIVLVALGLTALVSQGAGVLGLELSSGTRAAFNFRPGVLVPGPDGQEAFPQRGRIQAALREQARSQAAEAEDSTVLLRFADTAKVETILHRNLPGTVLKTFDANVDGEITLPEWEAGRGDAGFFKSLDADGNGQLTREELEAMPEWTYQVSTTVSDVKTVRQLIEATFGDALNMRLAVAFELQRSGPVAGMNFSLQAEDGGKTIIARKLADPAVVPDAAARDSLLDFAGGAMFVVRQLKPALTEPELAERIETIRGQPDFAEYQFNQTRVIGLGGTDKRGAFRSFAVLSRNPNVDYHGQPLKWPAFADNELKLLTAALARRQSLQSVQSFDPVIAGRTGQAALFAFGLSWLVIIIYLWVRFGSIRWGLAAVACLVHDVVIAVGMVALSAYIGKTALGRLLAIQSFKIDMAMVAAFLTIIGYSVNDTIVIFDRIRENRGKLATVDEGTINRSINQTISRTLLTTTTTLIAVVVMYAAGGPGIHAFMFTLLVGIVVGTYSSIAVASPLLLGFKHAVVGKVVRVAEAGARK